MWASIASFFRVTTPEAPPEAPPAAANDVTANGLRLRSIAEAHKDRDVLMNVNGADIDMCCLPVGPYETEEEIIGAVRVWASKDERNGGGFQIFKQELKPPGETKGPRRMLMCDRSGKVKPSKSNKPILHTKNCECAWGVWIEQCEEGWTTVELPKKARERLSQPGATMATVHNHTLMQSVAKVPTNAPDSYASVPPPNSKQCLSSVPTRMPAATPSSVPFPPICASPSHQQRVPFPPIWCGPPSHQQKLPSFHFARNNTPFADTTHDGAPNNYYASAPPTKKQRTSSVPEPLPAVTPSRRPFPPILICAPPFQNPNLPRFASFGVATHHQTPLLTEVFGFTPFGIHCRVCKNHVGASEQNIKSHLQSKKHGVFSKYVIRAFKTMADKEVKRLAEQADLEIYLVGRFDGFSCPCGAVFKKKKELNRHYKETKSCSFDPKEATPELLFLTVCGRTLSQATLNRLSSSQLTAEHLDSTATEGAWVPLSFNVARNNTSFAHNNHVGGYAPPLSVVHPKLSRFASFGDPTPRLTHFFGFTPFGMYCRVCTDGTHVGSREQTILKHLQSKHQGLFTMEAVKVIKAVADKEIEKLSREANLELYLQDHFSGFACKCEALFRNKKALVRHCKESNSCLFSPEDARPELLFKTVCGRTVSQATLNRLSSSLPTAEHFDFTVTEAARLGLGTDETKIETEITTTQAGKTCNAGDSDGFADACPPEHAQTTAQTQKAFSGGEIRSKQVDVASVPEECDWNGEVHLGYIPGRTEEI
jgi:uncharacterized C2H2 Zn-finger protein